MPCTSGCPTPGQHASWGDCARSKRLLVADVQAHKFNSNTHAELKAYVNAREAGLQPASTKAIDVNAAWKKTDETGTPFRADQ